MRNHAALEPSKGHVLPCHVRDVYTMYHSIIIRQVNLRVVLWFNIKGCL